MAVRELLRSLARLHEVTLVSLVRPGEEDLLPETAALGVQPVGLPFLDRRARGRNRWQLVGKRALALARSADSGYPLYVQKYWSADLSRRLIAVVEQRRPDAIQIEYFQLSLLCRDLRRWRESRRGPEGRASRPHLVLNSHELGSLPRRRRAAASRAFLGRTCHRLAAEAWERLQKDATTWADTTLCVTDQDQRLLEQQGGIRCRTVPLGVNTEAIQPVWDPEPPDRLLFVGSFGHRPNRVAARFLVEQVWPEVAESLPDGQLVLAGRGSRTFLGALAAPPERVSAVGFVADLTALYRECRLFVAPLTEGGGIKIKVLEAMARGIPVVSTPIGVEGIVGAAEEAVFITPEATFAATVIEALQTPAECRRRAERARRIIEERFSWASIARRLTRIYQGD